ncbi:DAK2 domain-containing protein [Salmonella enterica]|nr:DAK2 domain-containing protein [Salmonella enterica]
MQKPKKLFNNTDHIRSEIMQGLVYAGMGKIHALTAYCAVYRTIKSGVQTVIVSGGGSGHEPTFAGFVGEGGIDAYALGEVFTSPSPDQIIEASRAVHQGSGAKPGDKTMVDALAAAAEQANTDVALQLPEALSRCAQAAMAGAERTCTMTARFGRAKNLGERAIGHCDPGAVSMALILQFMAEFAHQD